MVYCWIPKHKMAQIEERKGEHFNDVTFVYNATDHFFDVISWMDSKLAAECFSFSIRNTCEHKIWILVWWPALLHLPFVNFVKWYVSICLSISRYLCMLSSSAHSWSTYASSLNGSSFGWYGKGQEKITIYIYDKLIGCVIRIPNEHEIFEAKNGERKINKGGKQQHSNRCAFKSFHGIYSFEILVKIIMTNWCRGNARAADLLFESSTCLHISSVVCKVCKILQLM